MLAAVFVFCILEEAFVEGEKDLYCCNRTLPIRFLTKSEIHLVFRKNSSCRFRRHIDICNYTLYNQIEYLQLMPRRVVCKEEVLGVFFERRSCFSERYFNQ